MKKLILIIALFSTIAGYSQAPVQEFDFPVRSKDYIQADDSLLTELIRFIGDGSIKVNADDSLYYYFPNGDSVNLMRAGAGGGISDANQDTTFRVRQNGDWADVDNNDISKFSNMQYNLAYWKYDLYNAIYNGGDNAKIAVWGDSYANNLFAKLRQEMQLLYGNGGGYHPAVAVYGTNFGMHIDVNGTIAQAVDLTDTLCFHKFVMTSSTAGAYVYLFNHQYNKFQINYRQVSGGGTFSWKIGINGSANNVSTDGATSSAWYSHDFGNITYTANDTLFLTIVSGTVRFYGFNLIYDNYREIAAKTKKKNVEVNYIGRGGSIISEFLNTDYTQINTLIDTLDPSLFIWIILDEPATNPRRGSDSLVDYLKAAKPGMDILVLNPNDEKSHLGTRQENLWFQFAKDDTLAFFDMNQYAGEIGDLYAAGLSNDSIHLNGIGQYEYYSQLVKFLLPQSNYIADFNTQRMTLDGNQIYVPNDQNLFINNNQKPYKLTGTSNIAFGFNSLMNATSAYNNVAFSPYALNSTTTGHSNISAGIYSLRYNTTGVGNIAIGSEALNSTISQNYSVAIGFQALKQTTAGGNIGIGYRALYSDIIGIQNVAIGYSALYNITSHYNTGIGYNSLKNLTGQGNTAVGNSTSSNGSNYAGNLNSFFGYRSAYTKTGGNNNSYYGAYSGSNSATSSNNAFFGYYAGAYETGNYKIIFDVLDRGDEATQRTSAPIYMIANATVANQTATINAGKINLNGTEINATGTIADNDATPDVTGANVFTYAGSANSIAVTDLDNPQPGAIYYLVGNSDTYTLSVGGANFKLASSSPALGQYDILAVLCVADNLYIELFRVDNTP